jgi:hypothetical protein
VVIWLVDSSSSAVFALASFPRLAVKRRAIRWCSADHQYGGSGR